MVLLQKSLLFIIKSGYKSRAGYNGTCTVFMIESISHLDAHNFYAAVWKLCNIEDLSTYFRQFSFFPYLSDKDQLFDFLNVHPRNIKSHQKLDEKYNLLSWAFMRRESLNVPQITKGKWIIITKYSKKSN